MFYFLNKTNLSNLWTWHKVRSIILCIDVGLYLRAKWYKDIEVNDLNKDIVRS